MVDKYLKDNLVAGASIRDGKGKRIDTTYQQKLTAGENITIKNGGKNLVDKDNLIKGFYSGTGSLSETTTETYRTYDKFPVKPLTSYTFSSSATSSTGYNWRICYWDSNKGFIRRNTSGISDTPTTLVTTADTYYLSVSPETPAWNYDLQVEEGETATSYEPFTDGTIISAKDTTYTAGANITIDKNNVISSIGGESGAILLPTVIDNTLNYDLLIPATTDYIAYGYTVVGNPNIVNNILTNPSMYNRVQTPFNMNTQNPYVFYTKFKTNNSYSNQRVLVSDDFYFALGIVENYLRLWLGNGNSWSIADNFQSRESINAGTWYYLKFTYDGNGYTLETSEDNISWTLQHSIGNNATIPNNKYYFGVFMVHDDLNLNGQIDLNNTKFITDNIDNCWIATK